MISIDMKLRVTDDFKKTAKGLLLYFAASSVVNPVYHMRKGDFNWSDALLYAGLNLIICLVVGAFFFLGMQPPEKKDEQK